MILLAGYGYWGKNLARNFSNELSAICEKEKSLLSIAKNLYPHVDAYDNYEQALEHPGIKAVLIATKTKDHLPMARLALEKGYDVWIEKPVCQDINEIKELIKISEQNNKIIFVDHTFCYHPAVEKIKTIDIGKPLYFDSTRISLGLFQPDVDVILDLAIHDVSIINFLYPDLELSEKYIVKNNHVNNIPNQAIVNLKFTNGFTANINVNWVSPVKKREIILTGNKSSIVYDDIDTDKIKIYQTGDIKEDYNSNKLGDMIAPRLDTTEALFLGKKHFLECIKNRNQPRTNIYESLKIMEWLLS
jgi:predicted dehydrogenase